MQIHNGPLPIVKLLTPALWLAAWVAVSAGSNVFAQSREVSEYQIKAAFLYNFAKFVEWPSMPSAGINDPIAVCVVGGDPFGNLLDKSTEDKTINGRKLVIRRWKPGQSVKACQIAFISSSENHRLRSLLDSLKGASVLTVGETKNFAALGGVINFTLEENKVRFEINPDAAQRAHLKVSSKLLKLATIVRDAGPGGRN